MVRPVARLFGLVLVLVALVGVYGALQVGRLRDADRRASDAQGRAERAERARIDAEAARDLARAEARIEVRYVDRVQVVREKAQIITREVPVYVTPNADAACVVPVGFVRLHDAAAANEPAGPATGNPDAPAEGVALSDVAAVVADNYATAHENAEQVTGLQDYVRALVEHCAR
ncbi:hypothetical protein J5226_21235 [Lysobacter sp. K5869]|nr:hypothetical protein J5226_21235 [Lysobacter sp. K5869]